MQVIRQIVGQQRGGNHQHGKPAKHADHHERYVAVLENIGPFVFVSIMRRSMKRQFLRVVVTQHLENEIR